MAQPRTSFVRWLTGTAVGSALLLSRLRRLGIDLNGKVFDMMGISPAAQEARRFEPQVAERAPLVVPPNSNRLPAPGSGQAPVAQLSWPDDPEAAQGPRGQGAGAPAHGLLPRRTCSGRKRRSSRTTGAPRSPYGPCPTLIGGAAINNAVNNKQ